MGPTQLYLDTARLGRMTPRAQQAQHDFTRLASEEGSSARFDAFLRSGSEGRHETLIDRYPGLSHWRGIARLKESLRLLAGSDPSLPVLLANRSAQVMKLATQLLLHPCDNVLMTDIGWPAYHDMLCSEAMRRGRTVTTVPIRERLLRGGMSEEELIAVIRDWFLREHCDGLFLTAVSHLGLRLPVARLVRTLEATAVVRFVVIDGAQDFCHTSVDLRSEYCDLYLAGCHKWLGAYHPMGLGFYGRPRSKEMIETVLVRLLDSGVIDDPLLRFSTELELGAPDRWTETVSLGSLFSCQGAVTDALEAKQQSPTSLPLRKANAAMLVGMAEGLDWQPLLPAEPFRTGILLLQALREKTRKTSAQNLRTAFCDRGVVLTAYDDGIVRLSMPNCGWQPCEIGHLQGVLQEVA